MLFESMSFKPGEQLNNEGTEQKKQAENLENEYGFEEDFEEKLRNGFLDNATKIAEKNNISEDKVREIVESYVLDNFTKINHKDILYMLDHFKIGEDFLNDERFIELAKDRVALKLSQGEIDNAYEALGDLNINKEFLESEQAKKAVEIGIQSILSLDNIDKAIETQKTFNIDDSFMDSAVKAEIKMRFVKDLVNGATSLQKKFNIPDDFMKETVKDEILARLSFGDSLSNIANFISKLEMDVSFLSDQKVKEAFKTRINDLVNNPYQEKIPVELQRFIMGEKTSSTEVNS